MWGPPESFIEGNNELALALVMTIPLMRFLQLQMKAPLVRHALTLTMLLSAVPRSARIPWSVACHRCHGGRVLDAVSTQARVRQLHWCWSVPRC